MINFETLIATKAARVKEAAGDDAVLEFGLRRAQGIDGGLTDAKIVASNDLDENRIQNLKYQGAKIDIWGIGTKLVTGYNQASLGGVFKLVAMKRGKGEWKYRIKLSEQIAKVTTPGVHQVRRFRIAEGLVGDMIFDERHPPLGQQVIVDPVDPIRRNDFSSVKNYEDLLKPVVREGKLVAKEVPLETVRQRRIDDVRGLHPTIKRFMNPHTFPVGLELSLHELKSEIVLERRGFSKTSATE